MPFSRWRKLSLAEETAPIGQNAIRPIISADGLWQAAIERQSVHGRSPGVLIRPHFMKATR
ncbi:hypothetical protein RISK_002188 [Rhodopirellula islandica]|uniref:Uncharacterized protein n=1 Tax=Rhodopirellula islandica TaxID=595434 RepID=A0A0J1BGA1_RHOIS|nr:hypothetical protein RISK_002188 [Rhodopirellula islandica]